MRDLEVRAYRGSGADGVPVLLRAALNADGDGVQCRWTPETMDRVRPTRSTIS